METTKKEEKRKWAEKIKIAQWDQSKRFDDELGFPKFFLNFPLFVTSCY